MDKDKQIAALTQDNKKLKKELDDVVRACKILEAKILDVKKRADQAYHTAREANNSVVRVQDHLRRQR